MENGIPSQPTPAQMPQHIRPKIGRNVLSFWAIVLGTCLLVLSVLATLIAKAGFVGIPLFSRLYTGPQPTRVVEAPKSTVAEFREILGKRLFLAQLAEPQSETLRVSVSESELTSALRDSISLALAGKDVSVERVQIVLLDNEVELLTLVRRAGIRANILIRFKPKIESRSVVFEPTFFQLGDFSLPISFAEQFAALLFSRDLGTWDVSSPQLQLEQMTVRQQTLEIVVRRIAR
jgi:uncharacterized protein YpmS